VALFALDAQGREARVGVSTPRSTTITRARRTSTPRDALRNGTTSALLATLSTSSPPLSLLSSRRCKGSFHRPRWKHHLAALRIVLDQLVTGHILKVNPAHAMRGPKYVVKKGQPRPHCWGSPRLLLDSIVVRDTGRATARNLKCRCSSVCANRSGLDITVLGGKRRSMHGDRATPPPWRLW